MKKIKVIGIAGSVRSNEKNAVQLEEFITKARNIDELGEKIRSFRSVFSNTDICIAYALFGAKEKGATIRLLPLVKLFKHVNEKIFVDKGIERTNEIENIDTLAIDPEQIKNLMNEIDTSDGIILGSPSYFGDRSSVANKLLQLTNRGRLLKEKAFGVVSVGAKRNGGQETTTIYALYEALMQDAVVVGNGPKTSQYGGTAWAGDPGKAIDDEFGLETCYGTGSRVADLSRVLSLGGDAAEKRELNICVLNSMDTKERKYEALIKDYFSVYAKDHKINIVNLIDYDFFRCTGCAVCPSPVMKEKNKNDESPYVCIIQNKKDALRELREILVKSDGIVVAGANSKDDLIYRYQAFMERTRFIRRSDFELTNVPVVGLQMNEIGAISNPLHNMKVLTSYIRHNMFVLKPVEILSKDGKVLSKDDFSEHLELMSRIKRGRASAGPVKVSYAATGYGDKRLDNTSAERS